MALKMIKNIFKSSRFRRSRTYFLEAAALFSILLLVDYIFLQDQSLNQLFSASILDPLWVLLSAPVWIVGRGHCSNRCFAFYIFVLGLPQQGVDQDYYDYLTDLSRSNLPCGP